MEDVLSEAFTILKENGFNKRQTAMMFLTGSRLYGTNLENSDYDIIAYVYPTIDDLYKGNKISKEFKSKLSEPKVEHVKVYSIKSLSDSLTKMGFDGLHLSSKPIYFDDTNTELCDYLNYVSENFINFVNNSKKNLLLSLNGVGFKKTLQENTLKNNVFSRLINYLIYSTLDNRFEFGFFKTYDACETLSAFGISREKTEELKPLVWEHEIDELLKTENIPFDTTELHDKTINLILSNLLLIS